MTDLKPCPHCGGQPSFGFMDDYDDRRYIMMPLECCARIEATMGWSLYKSLTEEEQKAALTADLIAQWNTRAEPEPVKVKPLVWVDTLHDDHPGGTTSKAETPFGEYAITSWSTGEWRTMYGPARGWEGRGTKEELQAAAQIDFESRITLTIDT